MTTRTATQTDPAIDFILTTAIKAAVRSALESAAVEGEAIVAHRVTQHAYGHLVVWLDCEAGKRARLVIWDGSTLVAPLSISARARTRESLRALQVSGGAKLLQDWTAVDSQDWLAA